MPFPGRLPGGGMARNQPIEKHRAADVILVLVEFVERGPGQVGARGDVVQRGLGEAKDALFLERKLVHDIGKSPVVDLRPRLVAVRIEQVRFDAASPVM